MDFRIGKHLIEIGDIVVLSHAHKYQYGSWSVWEEVEYKYIGLSEKHHTFQSTDRPKERFWMLKGELHESCRLVSHKPKTKWLPVKTYIPLFHQGDPDIGAKIFKARLKRETGLSLERFRDLAKTDHSDAELNFYHEGYLLHTSPDVPVWMLLKKSEHIG